MANSTTGRRKPGDEWVYVGTSPTALETGGSLSLGTVFKRQNDDEQDAALEAAGLIVPKTTSEEVAA